MRADGRSFADGRCADFPARANAGSAPISGSFTVQVDNVADLALNPMAAGSTVNGAAPFLSRVDIGTPPRPGSAFTCNGSDFGKTKLVDAQGIYLGWRSKTNLSLDR